jgi:hypothetical protein
MDDKEYPPNVYELVEEGKKVECIYPGCKGYLKKSTGFKESYNKKKTGRSLDSNLVNSANSLLCRCSVNCRHKFVALKNLFYKRSVLIKY